MSNYFLHDISDGEYAALVLGASYEGVFVYLSEIERKLKSNRKKGWIMLDSLLKTGSGENRFCSVFFDGESIQQKTARNVSLPRDSVIRHMSMEILKNNPDILSHCILTDQQKRLISRGVVI